MKELKVSAEEAAILRDRNHPSAERVWIDVRRRALDVAIPADEMTEVVDPHGRRLDVVHPSSINP